MMKTLLFLAAAVLLPLTSVEAGSSGFKNGTTFMLKVAKVQSTIQTGYFGTETKSKIPKGIPKFKKGARIAFKIGRKGELTGKGFTMDYAHASSKIVEYNSFEQGTVNYTQNAEISRKSKKATGGTMSFFIQDFSSGEPVFRTVVYTLK